MLYKIVKIRETNYCESVLLAKDRNDDGEDMVRIVAWHFDDDGDSYLQEEHVKMPEYLIESFIQDFSVRSAENFVELVSPFE